MFCIGLPTAEWARGGYREIQEPPERYTVIGPAALSEVCGFAKVADFQQAHRQWVEEALAREIAGRDERWSETIAVGSLPFADKVKAELGLRAMHRDVTQAGRTHTLREPTGDYVSRAP